MKAPCEQKNRITKRARRFPFPNSNTDLNFEDLAFVFFLILKVSLTLCGGLKLADFVFFFKCKFTFLVAVV